MHEGDKGDTNTTPLIPLKTPRCDEFLKVHCFRENFLVLIVGFNKLISLIILLSVVLNCLETLSTGLYCCC